MNSAERQKADEPLAARLIHDAEARAAAGEEGQALLLLRWASRICADAFLPTVLLAYHRVRALRQHPDGGTVPAIPAEPGVAPAHGLGFPMPRFPTVPPMLDETAFVPAPVPRIPPRPAVASNAADGHPAPARAVRSPSRYPSAAIVGMAALAIAVLVPLRERIGTSLPGIRGGGVPSVSLNDSGDARVLLTQGRALLLRGDTAAALSRFDSAANAADAGALKWREVAEQVTGIPGAEGLAAETYLRAFEGGMPHEHWPAAADALQRAGRAQQADRLRALLRGRVSSSPAGQLSQ